MKCPEKICNKTLPHTLPFAMELRQKALNHNQTIFLHTGFSACQKQISFVFRLLLKQREFCDNRRIFLQEFVTAYIHQNTGHRKLACILTERFRSALEYTKDSPPLLQQPRRGVFPVFPFFRHRQGHKKQLRCPAGRYCALQRFLP